MCLYKIKNSQWQKDNLGFKYWGIIIIEKHLFIFWYLVSIQIRPAIFVTSKLSALGGILNLEYRNKGRKYTNLFQENNEKSLAVTFF